LMFVLGDSGSTNEKAAGLQVVPAVGPGQASLWLSGSF
jgi:hypothetical protein